MVRYRPDCSTQDMIERAETEGIDLEERTFENLIWFFQDELLKLHVGEPCGLSYNDRKKLFQTGIIGNRFKGKGTTTYVLDKALRILAQIMEEDASKQEDDEIDYTR